MKFAKRHRAISNEQEEVVGRALLPVPECSGKSAQATTPLSRSFLVRTQLIRTQLCRTLGEFFVLILLFYAFAGDAPPMVNEAHYLVKAKNFWDPNFCASDLFASSGKAHWFFYLTFGWLTKFFSLSTTAWIGRVIGWSMIAAGLIRVARSFDLPTSELESDKCWKLSPLVIGLVWIIGIHHGNLAGEWVVGGIEAKVPAYGFVLFALAELLRRNWNRVWVLLGVASAFHVLTGGWSVVAATIAWVIIERGKKRWFTPWLILGGLIALLGVVPAAMMSMGATPEQSSIAARTYSYFRISHHLTPSEFAAWWYVRFGALVGLTGWMLKTVKKDAPNRTTLSAWTFGAIALAMGGFVAGTLPAFSPEIAAKLLRFYWFRLPDAVVPLTLGILVASSLSNTRSLSDTSLWRRRISIGIVSLCLILLAVHCADRIDRDVPPSVDNRLLGWDAQADRSELHQAYQDWLSVCFWARESTGPDEVFLTPRHQQTFKWYAHRAEVVNWKDVPQDAASLVEWRRRFEAVFPMRLNTVRVTINYDALREYRARYGTRLMIVDRRVCGPNLPLVRLYPTRNEDNPTYAVYELPK